LVYSPTWFGICVKAPKGTGEYEDKNCTKSSETEKGKYNLVSSSGGNAEQKAEFTFTDKSKTTELKIPGLGTIICKKDTSKGRATGGSTTEDEITLTDCTNTVFKTNCYNVAATKEGKSGGTIEVGGDPEGITGHGKTLQVTIPDELVNYGETSPTWNGHEYVEVEPAEGEVWTEYSGNRELGFLAAFYCKTPLGEDPFVIVGNVAGVTTPVNVMTKKSEVVFGEGKGEQALVAITFNENKEQIQLHASLIGVEQIKWHSKIEILEE
jgi:hypothetical protein